MDELLRLHLRQATESSEALRRLPLQDRPGLACPNRFGSPHDFGCNMVLCDGSLRVSSYSIDAKIHAMLGNRADGQVIDPSQLP